MTDARNDTRIVVLFWGTGGAGVRYTYRVVQEILADVRPENLHVSVSVRNGWLDRMKDLGVGLQSVKAYESHRDALLALLKLPGLTARFMAFCVRRRPHVVVIPMNFAQAFALGAVASMLRARVVYVVHDATPHPGDYRQAYQRISQWILMNCARKLVAPSAFVAENALANMPRRLRDTIEISPLNAVAERSADSPRTLGAGPVRFLFLGRLLRYKGLHLLAEALGRIAHRDDWRLTIAGNGFERDFVMKTFAAFPQVDLSWIKWLEESEVDHVISTADAIVCPYIEASQSGVIPEAQRFGLPAVVTPVGALMEQVDQGAAGWIAKSVTSKAIAEALVQVLDDRAGYAARSAAALALTSEKPGSSNWMDIIRRTAQAP